MNGTNTTQISILEFSALLAFHVVVFIGSFVGNSLVILLVYKNVHKKMRTTMNLFVVNMATSDLLTTTLVPLDLAVLEAGEWPIDRESTTGSICCKLHFGSWYLSSGVSLLSLVAIAVDRFWAVFFPTKRPLTTRRPSVVLTAIWFISIVFVLPILMETKVTNKNSSGKLICLPVFTSKPFVFYHVSYFAVFGGLPIMVILILYPAILVKLWKRKIPGNPSVANQELRDRTNRKVTVLSVALMVAFIVSWLPYSGESLKTVLKPDHYIFTHYYSGDVPATAVLTYVSCVLNPLICIVFNHNFRTDLITIFQSNYCFNCNTAHNVENIVINNSAGRFVNPSTDPSVELNII